MSAPSDGELVARAREGDAEAFGQLVEAHKERVYGLALQMTRNHADADELSQEAFVKAFRSLDRFEGRSGFFTWMYRITVNLCLSHLKGRGRHVPLPDPSDDDHPRPELGAPDDASASADARDRKERLWRALEALGPEVRAAAVSVYLQELTPREASAALGCAEATVHWRLFRARKILRRMLLTEGGEADVLA